MRANPMLRAICIAEVVARLRMDPAGGDPAHAGLFPAKRPVGISSLGGQLAHWTRRGGRVWRFAP